MSSSSAVAPRKATLVPADFAVPERLVEDGFMLRMLTIDDVDRDFEAVLSSSEHLQSLDPDSDWPEGLTRQQNLIDLGWHQKEFQRRTSFAYTVVNPEDTRTLGCVYIYPSELTQADAEVFLWARQSELASGLEARLFAAVRRWITEDWPFRKAVFPGRDQKD